MNVSLLSTSDSWTKADYRNGFILKIMIYSSCLRECTFQKFNANKYPKVYSFSSNEYMGKNRSVRGV